MTSKEDPKDLPNAKAGLLSKFLPGGESSAPPNREEYEARIKALPPEQREFAEESARFADLWQYFAEHKMQLPEDVVAEVGGLPKLPQSQQSAVLHSLNHRLMEYLNDAREDSGIRQ